MIATQRARHEPGRGDARAHAAAAAPSWSSARRSRGRCGPTSRPRTCRSLFWTGGRVIEATGDGRARALAPPPRLLARRAARRGGDAAAASAADARAAGPRAPEGRRRERRRRAQDGAARPRALDGLRRADARHVPGRARPDDRLDRAADDRRRPRRPRPPLVGRHRRTCSRRRSRRRSTASSATCTGASPSSWPRS